MSFPTTPEHAHREVEYATPSLFPYPWLLSTTLVGGPNCAVHPTGYIGATPSNNCSAHHCRATSSSFSTNQDYLTSALSTEVTAGYSPDVDDDVDTARAASAIHAPPHAPPLDTRTYVAATVSMLAFATLLWWSKLQLMTPPRAWAEGGERGSAKRRRGSKRKHRFGRFASITVFTMLASICPSLVQAEGTYHTWSNSCADGYEPGGSTKQWRTRNTCKTRRTRVCDSVDKWGNRVTCSEETKRNPAEGENSQKSIERHHAHILL